MIKYYIYLLQAFPEDNNTSRVQETRMEIIAKNIGDAVTKLILGYPHPVSTIIEMKISERPNL